MVFFYVRRYWTRLEPVLVLPRLQTKKKKLCGWLALNLSPVIEDIGTGLQLLRLSFVVSNILNNIKTISLCFIGFESGLALDKISASNLMVL